MKTRPMQCKILIAPEEGWFGQPKYSTPSQNSLYLVSVSALCTPPNPPLALRSLKVLPQ